MNRAPVDRARGGDVGLTAVLFSPEDLAIVKGGPEERRRFLDQAAGRLRSLAVAERLEYERVLRQRNGLLKAAHASPRALKSLDVWDEQLVRTGAALVATRVASLAQLGCRAGKRYGEISDGAGEVCFGYRPSWAEGEVASAEVAECLEAAVRAARGRDLERGVSTVGPHRDDLAVLLDGMDARTHASQGEQRSLALAFRLAERDLVADSREEEPVLLLDDVLSELDDRRRERLTALAAGAGQTIATATSAPAWPVAVARRLSVEDGRITAGG